MRRRHLENLSDVRWSHNSHSPPKRAILRPRLGFSGSDDDWATEFQEICDDRGWKDGGQVIEISPEEDKSITQNNFRKPLCRRISSKGRRELPCLPKD